MRPAIRHPARKRRHHERSRQGPASGTVKKQTYIEKYQAAGQNYIHARRIYDAIQTGNHQTIEIALDYIVANYQSAYRYHFGEPICEYCQNIYERALAITPEDVQAAKSSGIRPETPCTNIPSSQYANVSTGSRPQKPTIRK